MANDDRHDNLPHEVEPYSVSNPTDGIRWWLVNKWFLRGMMLGILIMPPHTFWLDFFVGVMTLVVFVSTSGEGWKQ